jgi:putative DNA primase/helicase
MGSVLEAALRYAASGRPVFPCNGKRPYVPRGLHDATTDPALIEDWWRRWPEANIGIRTGAVSELLVIDVDDPDALHELERQHGKLPRTASVTTTRGGQHFWLRHPGGEVANSASKLAPGIAVRADT